MRHRPSRCAHLYFVAIVKAQTEQEEGGRVQILNNLINLQMN